MAIYTRESIDRLRDTIDFVELVSTKSELKRAGSNRYSGLCPFHDERTPSFSVNPVEKVYYCFGCQAAGDVFRFIQETDGLDFKETVEYLADRYRVQLEEDSTHQDPKSAERRKHYERFTQLHERAVLFYERYLWESDEAESGRKYLKQRGFQQDILKRFRVGYSPSIWNALLQASKQAGFGPKELYEAGLLQRAKGEGRVYDRFRGRVMFPLADTRGRPCGFGARALRDTQQPKYLNSAENDFFQKGKQLYGVHLARSAATKADRIILVEGYLDVIALHQAGIENVVCSMGTALTMSQLQLLGRLASHVFLAFDADSAGQKAMEKISELAGPKKIKLSVVPLPVGCDPADVVMEAGDKKMHELIAGALPVEKFLVERVLSDGDLTTAQGKDDSIARLQPILRRLPESVLRHEILQNVAQQLGIRDSLLIKLLQETTKSEGGRVQQKIGQVSVNEKRALSPITSRQQHVEQSLLVFCLARPDLGEKALSQVDFETDFADPQFAYVAKNLAGKLEHPMQDLPAELTGTVAELVVRASDIDISDETFEVEWLQFLLQNINRKIAGAKHAGTEIVEHARQRLLLREAYDKAVEKAMGTTL